MQRERQQLKERDRFDSACTHSALTKTGNFLAGSDSSTRRTSSDFFFRVLSHAGGQRARRAASVFFEVTGGIYPVRRQRDVAAELKG